MADESMRSVLIIEDEPYISELLGYQLARLQFSVEIAQTGDEALRKIFSRQYAVILLDLNIPAVDGMTIMKRMREAGKQTGTIVMSACTSMEIRLECKKLGAKAFLTKPFNRMELLDAVTMLVGS